MILTLDVTGAQAGTLGPARRKVFDAVGGSIGRQSTNDWVLQHPYVSSRHALIRYEAGVFTIEDARSSNGVFVNGSDQKLQPGERHALQDGDTIFIEPFDIRASVTAAPSHAVASAGDPIGDRAQAGPIPDDPFGLDMDGAVSSGSVAPLPGDLLLGEEMPSGESVIARLGTPAPRPPARPAPRAADLHSKSVISEHYVEPPPAAPGAPELIPAGWDDLLGSDPDVSPPPGEEAMSPSRAPRRPAPPIAGQARVRRSPARAPESPASSRSAGAASIDAGAGPPAARGAMPDAPLDVTALLKAAGIEGAAVTPELAQTLGVIIRLVVEGVMDLLRARQVIKHEFRIPGTRIEPQGNNPLKFSSDIDDALHNLLVKRTAGWLGPVDAFEDAFDDLRHHQTAMLEGVRVAFDAMLAQFEPDRLEQAFERSLKGSLGLVPGKVRYWDLYRNKFGDMVGDAETSFAELFGDEFARAYEAQLDALKARSREHPARPSRRSRS